MNWVEAIFSRLRELWPFIRIRPGEQGVRFRYGWRKGSGVKIQLLEPGIALQVWFLDDISHWSTQDRVHDLSSLPITTKDDIAVTYSVNINFYVSDPVAAETRVHSFSDSLNALAMTHCSQRIRDWTWKELLENQKDLEKSLKGTLTTRAKKWGVEVSDVGLTILVKAKPIALMNIA